MDRPVLTEVSISDSWSSENISKSGIGTVAKDPGLFRGGLIALLGYDAGTAMMQFSHRGQLGVTTVTAG
jgi:hypothetical protein